MDWVTDERVLPILTLVLGVLLGAVVDAWRERRQAKRAAERRRREAERETLMELQEVLYRFVLFWSEVSRPEAMDLAALMPRLTDLIVRAEVLTSRLRNKELRAEAKSLISAVTLRYKRGKPEEFLERASEHLKTLRPRVRELVDRFGEEVQALS